MHEAAMSGLSLRLAEQVLRPQWPGYTARTAQAAARALLDAVGVMQAASALSPEAQPFLALASESGGRAEASVLGTGARVPAPLAAFANGALAHALDYEDGFDGAPVHPNASLVPAVLALAESEGSVSGHALLESIAIGCDVSCRLALSLRRPLEAGGWYPPPILGAWGAVAGCARLLGLTPRQLLDAWSLVLLQTSTPGEIKYGNESAIRAVREAFPAQAAVTAVRLARRGVRGFDAPLEGRAGFYRLFADGQCAPDALLEDIGQRWYVEALSFKPWPSCRGTHAAIECALVVRERMRRESASPEGARITVEGGEVQAMLAEPLTRKQAPATPIEAKFSLPFTVAAALHAGEVTLETFSAAGLASQPVLALARQVQYLQRADWGRDQAVCGAVRVELPDGRAWREEIREPRGSPARPLDDAALIAKFIDCTGRALQPLAPAAATRLAERLLQIGREPNVGPAPWSIQSPSAAT